MVGTFEIIGCEKGDPGASSAVRNEMEKTLAEDVTTPAAVPFRDRNHDSDGVVEMKPVVVAQPVTVAHDVQQSVVSQQVRVIKQHQEAVDRVDADIRAIQREMKQRRAVDLESLAKRRHWATKPQRGNSLYGEWEEARLKKMDFAEPLGGP